MSKKDGQLSTKKKLGASYGHGCAMVSANLTYKDGDMTSTHNDAKIPVQSWCEKDSKSYTLVFTNFGYNSEGNSTGHSAYVDCKKEGTVKFNEAWSSGTSSVECLNPQKFCAARFDSSGKNGALCDKSCNSNGRCQKVGYASNGGDSGSDDSDSGSDDGDSGSDDGDSGSDDGDSGSDDGDSGSDDGDSGSDDGDSDSDDGESQMPKGLKDLCEKVDTYGYSCVKNASFESIKLGYNKMAHRASLRQISHKKNLATNNNWMCWCYSDFYRTNGACSAL